MSPTYDHNTLCCVALKKEMPNQQANRYTVVVHTDESGTLWHPLVSLWGHSHPVHCARGVSCGMHGDYTISESHTYEEDVKNPRQPQPELCGLINTYT